MKLHWIGGATGAWYDPANWQDGQIPCDGGIAVFPDSAVTIAGDDKSIDIGETGLTVRNAKTLVFVVKNDKAPIQFEAPAVGPGETYTGTGGTNIFATTAEWAGTNLTFTAQYGYPTALRLTHSKNLSPDATLNLKSGAVLIVDKGVCARIAHLVIDGQSWPEGKYRASTCPSIAGEGSLVVGPKLGLMLFIR